MALTGIQILKMLPKSNCGKCGIPTCLAFAMNLASGKAELDSCPYVSDEAKEHRYFAFDDLPSIEIPRLPRALKQDSWLVRVNS